MTVFQFVSISVFLVIVIATASTGTESDASDNGTGSTGYLTYERIKRGLPYIIYRLFKESKLIITGRKLGIDYKLYEKKGGIKTALKDFQRLKPTNVRISTGITSGKVGDIDVALVDGRKLIIKSQYKPYTFKSDVKPRPSRQIEREIMYTE